MSTGIPRILIADTKYCPTEINPYHPGLSLLAPLKYLHEESLGNKSLKMNKPHYNLVELNNF